MLELMYIHQIIVILVKYALLFLALVTTIVYVLDDVPSSAVTTTSNELLPVVNDLFPSPVIVAFESFAVATISILVTEYATDAV